MRKCLFLSKLFLLLSFSCQSHGSYTENADHILDSFSKKMQKSGLALRVKGGEMPNGDVRIICLGFALHEQLSLEEGRKLLVKITEQLLDQINNDQKIRPHLHNYPFSPNNVEVSLSFLQKNGQHFNNDKTTYISLLVGKIFYSKIDNTTSHLKTFFDEPYEEALRIVRQEQMNQSSERSEGRLNLAHSDRACEGGVGRINKNQSPERSEGD